MLARRAWQLARHVITTYFMCFWVVVMVGLLLELRSRRCFLMSCKSCELQWQPSGFAAALAHAAGTIARPFYAAPGPPCQPLLDDSAAAAPCRRRPSAARSAAACIASSSEGASSSAGCCAPERWAGQCMVGAPDSGSEEGLSERAGSGPCGAEGIEQIQACQQLLEDRDKLAKQHRYLRYKCAHSLFSS